MNKMVWTEEAKKKRIETMNKKYGKSTWNKGLSKETDKRVLKHSKKLKGRILSPNSMFKEGHMPGEEVRKKLSDNWDYNKHFSKKTIEKISKNGKKNWKNKEYRDKTLRAQKQGLNSKPNKPEKILIKIIEKNNLPFDFIGDGKIWFNGKNHSFNPDFLSRNSKHIIEVFGEYWHKKHKHGKKDKERFVTYKKYGYKTLVLWESELFDEVFILDRINNFLAGGKPK